MKCLIPFLIPLLLVGDSLGQNLIPNPSFEDLDRCPFGPGTLRDAIPWYTPNQKSPDLYHRCVGLSCDRAPFVCVPENTKGYQEPVSGDGYAGIHVGSEDTIREYLGVPLIESLQGGETYVLTYYLSRSDESGWAIDRMGVHFTDTLLSAKNQLPSPPLLTTTGGEFLENAESWIQIRDTFVAQGGETYMTVGNFSDVNQTNAKRVKERGSPAYYFFDDFKLVPVEQNLYLTGDTSICLGDSTSLTAHNGDAYVWKDSMNQWITLSETATLTVAPSKTTTYVVNSGLCKESITVFVHTPPTVDLQSDTTLCEKATLVLDASSSAYQVQYRWQDQSTRPEVTVREAGTYRVEVSNKCGSIADSLQIDYESCNCPISFPTAFSPNYDGINDAFFPVYDCEFEAFHWAVFDRWGNQVFETNDLNGRWDGTANGVPLPSGVYAYILRFRSPETNRIVSYGSVSLFR